MESSPLVVKAARGVEDMRRKSWEKKAPEAVGEWAVELLLLPAAEGGLSSRSPAALAELGVSLRIRSVPQKALWSLALSTREACSSPRLQGWHREDR